VCALAHVLEREGVATLTLVTKARRFPELLRPPRVLFCDFPMGRPLGVPRDARFQHAVLAEAFGMLSASGPVLRDFPQVVDDQGDVPLSCVIPPTVWADVSPSVGEARGLRGAFQRGGGGISSAIDLDFVEESLQAFDKAADGVPWREAGFPTDLQHCGLAVRGFYEQAAVGLSNGAGGARSAESWFAHHTIAGATLARVRTQLREQGEPVVLWRSLLSAFQSGD
jgi:hypothetical protein